MNIGLQNTQSNPYFTGKKVVITKEQILELRKTAKSEKEVYQALGVSMATYYNWLKKLGITSKLQNYQNELSKISKDEFESLLKNKTPMEKICKIFKITTTAYYNLIDKFGFRTKYVVGATRKAVTKEKLQELVDKNLSIDEICSELNISKSAYYDLIKNFDINTTHRGYKKRVDAVSKEQLKSLLEQGKNYDEISEELQVSKSSIGMLILKFKLETKIGKTKAITSKIDKERLEALIAEDKSIAEICEELGIQKRLYASLLDKFGIVTKHRQSRKNMLAVTKEKLQELVDSNLPVSEMAKRLKISEGSFYYLLKYHDINYNYAHHSNEKFVPKHRLQQVSSEWENKDELLNDIGIVQGTFNRKANIARVETKFSKSIKTLSEINPKEVQEYLEQGATPKEICELFGISRTIYNRIIIKFSLTTVAKKENLNADKATKEKLQELINKGKTKPEICKELGISFSTLKKRLYKFGLDY